MTLDKGLKFAPKRNLNKFDAYVDVRKFVRKLNIKKYMLNQPVRNQADRNMDEGRVQYSTLRNKSLFNPQVPNNHHIEVFSKMVLKDLDSLKVKRIPDPMIIHRGIKELEKNKGIIIRPADKGGAIVVLSREYYYEELDNQLKDTNTYIKLKGNPTREYKEELAYLVYRGRQKGVLNKREYKYLVTDTCRVPIIYTIPKIHKDAKKPPGRPIINGIQSINSRLGEYVDRFMQPLVPKTRAYLRDTKHLIQILETIKMETGDTYLLATADVASLYTVINHKEAIDASKWALDKFSDLVSKQKRFILRSLAYGLQHNYFWHKSEYFRQLNGVAMGAKYAPSVANIYMAEWEETAIYNDSPDSLIVYKRFIDDCIVLWKGDDTSLKQFFEKLNKNGKNIKLTYTISDKIIQFLDLEISLEYQKISTKTFFKPVDRNSYIPTDSCHYDPWLINVPKGQLTRIRRNCTDDNTFMDQAKFVGSKFTQKGYSEDFIQLKIEEVKNVSRENLISDKKKFAKVEQEIPIILNFNVQHRQLESVFRKHWPILKADRQLQDVLPVAPKVVYRRAPTLRDLVAKSVPDPPNKKEVLTFWQGKGFFPCKRCFACRKTNQNGQKCSSFSSNVTKKDYKIKELITCRTEGVVYVLQCPCSLQYVGRTKRPMWKRIREHVQNIEKGCDEHNVSRHFKQCHNNDPRGLKFWAIDKYIPHWRGSHKVRELSKCESRWIHEMATLAPNGLNIEFDLNCFIADF